MKSVKEVVEEIEKLDKIIVRSYGNTFVPPGVTADILTILGIINPKIDASDPIIFSRVNDIENINTCIACRKAYLKQMICKHNLQDGIYNQEYCKKCTYDTEKINSSCFSETKMTHLTTADIQRGDICIVCNESKKQHRGKLFPCPAFEDIGY